MIATMSVQQGAQTPSGDTRIQAQNIEIKEARETGRQSSEQKFSQSDLSVSLTSPVLGAIQGVRQTAQAVGDTGSSRMQALGAATAALQAKDAIQDTAKAAQSIASGGKVGESDADRFAQYYARAIYGPQAVAVTGIAAVPAYGATASAVNAYRAAQASYSLGTGMATGAVVSGGLDYVEQKKKIQQGTQQEFSYQDLVISTIWGSVGGGVNTKLFQAAAIPNSLSNWLTVQGASIRTRTLLGTFGFGGATKGIIHQNEAGK